MDKVDKTSGALAAGAEQRLLAYELAAPRGAPLSRQMLADILVAFDIFALFASGLIAHFLYLGGGHASALIIDYVSLMALVSIAFYFIARHKGLYAIDKMKSVTDQLASMIYVCLLTFATAFGVLFFLKISDHFSRFWFLEWFAFFVAAFGIGRALLLRHYERLARSGSLRRPVAVIGSGAQFAKVKDMLRRDERYYQIVSLCDTAEFSFGNAAQNAVWLSSFIHQARERNVEEVIVALPAGQIGQLEGIVRQVQMLPVDVNIVPDFGGANIPLMRLQHAANMAFITTISKPITNWGAILKTVEDKVIAAVGLVLSLPVMALIAALVKLDSKGPVLFRQRRHGYNHQVIEVLKFRTMTVMEDGDVVQQARRNDRRVTRVGRILRRTSLDELPQLINVLRGEMSIVGPRPHALAHNNYYSDFVENYANRHRVKPGITGWAQVHGFRGETTNPEMMAERVRYDLEYIDNWSLWLDLKIIMMTPFFGLFRKSAY